MDFQKINDIVGLILTPLSSVSSAGLTNVGLPSISHPAHLQTVSQLVIVDSELRPLWRVSNYKFDFLKMSI